MNKSINNDKSSKGVNSHNIHLFTSKGSEKQHGQTRVAGGVCWMRWLNDSDDDDDVCLKKAANERNSQFKWAPKREIKNNKSVPKFRNTD